MLASLWPEKSRSPLHPPSLLPSKGGVGQVQKPQDPSSILELVEERVLAETDPSSKDFLTAFAHLSVDVGGEALLQIALGLSPFPSPTSPRMIGWPTLTPKGMSWLSIGLSWLPPIPILLHVTDAQVGGRVASFYQV